MSQDEVPRVWHVIPDDWQHSSATQLRVSAAAIVFHITLFVHDTPLGRQYFIWFHWSTERDTRLRDLVFPTLISAEEFVKSDVILGQLQESDRSMRQVGRPTHLARIAGLRCTPYDYGDIFRGSGSERRSSTYSKEHHS
jgi:hypothetical protein